MRNDDPKIERLAAIAAFAGCRRRELRRAAALVDEVARRAGDVLVRQGGRGDEVFVVVNGRATVFRNDAWVADLGPGDLIGEISLLDGAPRTATVIAQTDVELLVLDRRAFDRLVVEVPFVARRLLTAIAERLRNVSDDAARAFAATID